MNEFAIIEHFFNSSNLKREDVILGIGDDCAIVQPPTEQELLITTDTLVSGVHFLPDMAAYDIGFKSLAVNLSDLAAKGAEPAWITLALTLPDANEIWLKAFSKGLFELANRYHVQLIGGDLTKGPLSVTIQAIGFAPKNKAPRRSGAKPGDLIYVSHTLGDAALGLAYLKNSIAIAKPYQDYLAERHCRPEPRIAMGKQLREIAHASIDISDGLVADLGHILDMSNVGATVYVDSIPLSDSLLASVSREEGIVLALTGGDDYELCFTVEPNKAHLLDTTYTCIGKINNQPGLDLRYQNEKKYNGTQAGYKHFS
jgi:thiamine-monophosphate kinase